MCEKNETYVSDHVVAAKKNRTKIINVPAYMYVSLVQSFTQMTIITLFKNVDVAHLLATLRKEE